MAITKLTGFTAEAEVMGRLITVSFHEKECLELRGLSYEEAVTALELLAAKRIIAVNPAAAMAKSETPPKAPAPAVKKPLEKKSEALEQTKQYEVPAEPSAPQEVPAEAPKAEVKPLPPPPKDAPVQEAASTEAPPSTSGGGKVDLTQAKQLKDVLLTLMEQEGLKTPEALTRRCEELKAAVPVLGRIQDLPGRIKRSMALLEAA